MNHIKTEFNAAAWHERDKAQHPVQAAGCAFIAPAYPKSAKSEAAKYALARWTSEYANAVTLHIYQVAQLMEEAWRAGAAYKTQWKRTADEVPDTDRSVLAYHPEFGRHTAFLERGKVWVWDLAKFNRDPTHWSEIPHKPKEEDEPCH